MADRVFCIDFGSAYTKVALRRDPSADGELLSTRVSTSFEPSFCIPTSVAVDRRGPRAIPEFGDRVSTLQPGGGIEVYRNWKKWIFFSPSETARPSLSPLESLLQSEELRDLANRFGVATGQIAHLQHLVTTARNLIAGPAGRVVSSETQQQSVAASLAPHFFIWLRQQVLEACSRLPSSDLRFESIPVRITIPALDHGKLAESQPGWKILTDALGKAGWPLHPTQPTIAEPYANAIGVLTQGANVFQRGRVRTGEMFGRSPFLTVLKDSENHPVFRALVIDVGAFTTDFAAVSVKPGEKQDSGPEVQVTVEQHSLALGISELDQRMIAALPREKGDWLKKASVLDWEDFRPAVYSEAKGLRKPDLGVIGGPADAEVVRDCLREFVDHLAGELKNFLNTLEALPAGGLQELILTGGGNSIPAIRDGLMTVVMSRGEVFAKIHAPALKRVHGGPPIDKLDITLSRGASAIGGVSIFFE